MLSADRIIEFLVAQRAIAAALVALWAFVSLCIIARLWVLHPRDRLISKLVWSLVLLIPLFGWLFFAAFYRSPEASTWTGHAEHGRDADVGFTGSGHV
jgi:hypothetical protein